MNIEQANILANKLDRLNQFFDITQSTVDEITKEVDTIDDFEVIDEDENSIITLSLLKSDFGFIRKTLIDNIENGKKVIDKLSLEIEVEQQSAGSVISAYAELVGTINSSLKLLSSSYKDIIDMNIKINKIQKEGASTGGKDKEGGTKIEGGVSITNNTIQASIKDIVNAIQLERGVVK